MLSTMALKCFTLGTFQNKRSQKSEHQKTPFFFFLEYVKDTIQTKGSQNTKRHLSYPVCDIELGH